MVGFEKKKAELEAEGISVFAAAVDDTEKTAEVQKDVSFPVCHGVTRDVGDKLGSWWDERRDFIQPSEFVIRQDGTVVSATYSSAPIGRVEAGDVLSLLGFLKKMRAAKAAKKD